MKIKPLWKRTASLRTILLSAFLALGVRIGVAEAYEVDGPSMRPTLENGDRIWVHKSAYGLTLPFSGRSLVQWRVPEPGDVIVFTSHLDGKTLVKRVVAVAGDNIEMREGRPFRNGVALSTGRHGVESCPLGSCEWREEQLGEAHYRTWREVGSVESSLPPMVVPPGTVFVLGDGRDMSNDSRRFGAVAIDRIRGRLFGSP